MLVLEIVVVQLLLACALALIQCVHAFALENRGTCILQTGGTNPGRGAAWSKLEVARRPLPSTHG